MMMSQPYYHGDYDTHSRSLFRARTASRYDRAVAYTHGLYDLPQHELRSDNAGHSASRTVIQEQSPETGHHGHARRRIQVACSRCRRRKIKCTGDPGDGSGCSACRSAGADRNQCTFMRVGSAVVPVVGIDILSSGGGLPVMTSTTAYDTDATSTTYDSGIYQTQHRPSLPTLQTRTAYPDYDSYGASPLDDYSYAPTPFSRQQSYSSTYAAENFRPWTSGSLSAPVTSTSPFYEPGAPFSFGSLQATGPFATTPSSRLPSVANEPVFNMGSLHYSLPTQTVQERRLPAPYTQSSVQSTQHSTVPQIRPLGSFSEKSREHATDIHTRNSMPWSVGGASAQPVTRKSSASTRPARLNHGFPISSGASASSPKGEPILGYQFSSASGNDDSPTNAGSVLPESLASASGSYTASTMLPPPTCNIRTPSTSTSHPAAPVSTPSDETPHPSSSARGNTASLYSFSAGAETPGRLFAAPHGVQGACTDGRRSSTSQQQQHHHTTMRHPQPQHAASVDELRRRSSLDQRSGAAHRISVSNLNGCC